MRTKITRFALCGGKPVVVECRQPNQRLLEAKEGADAPVEEKAADEGADGRGGAGYAIGKRHEEGSQPEPVPSASTAGSAFQSIDGAASEANRIDALTKLKSLLDDGILTQEQYDSEHARLTAGI
jgi:hypothetical protein